MITSTRSSHHSGSALVAVFWIMSILAMAVFASLSVVKIQADVATSESHGRLARELAEKGIAIAVHGSIKRSDPLLTYQDEYGSSGYESTFTSLATTFGLNALINKALQEYRQDGESLGNTLLYQIITEEWEMDPSDAQLFLHCLFEWVDADDQVTTTTGWEEINYESEGFTGRPYNRYFSSLDEVRLVHGYDALEAAKPDWSNYFNIWTTHQIDLASADPEIISLNSLSPIGRIIDIESASLLHQRIIGEDGIKDTEDDLQQANVEQLLTEFGSGDISLIADRYIFEGLRPKYSLVESKGYSGNISLTIKLALLGRGNTPQILHRKETLDYSYNEQ